MHFPPRFGSIPTLFRHPLALLGSVLLICITPIAGTAQSVTFTGAQTTLPFTDLNNPFGVAADSAGDVFIVDSGNKRVVELPKTSTGYGQQTTLPFSGLSGIVPGNNGSPGAWGIALDGAGNVFIGDYGNKRVVELPKTSTGYGPQIMLPFSGLQSATGVAVDSGGDVFVADPANERVVELPKTATGYGTQMTLPTWAVPNAIGVAVDSAGDVFIVDNGDGILEELPWTGTGYGRYIILDSGGVFLPSGIAVDGAGNVFIAGSTLSVALEFTKTSTGYGSPTTLPINLNQPFGVAVNRTGNLFFADTSNNRAVEFQRESVDFGGANVCAPGTTTPAPCNQTLTFYYGVTKDGTLGTPKVLTGDAPDQDFTLASGSTCVGQVAEGSTCAVDVTFAPLATGVRSGTVEIVDGGGAVLATTTISGLGLSPANAPPVAQISATTLQFGTVPFGITKTLPLTVTNIGGQTLTVAPSIAGQSFMIAEDTCAGGLTTGQSCTLQVKFSPVTLVWYNGLLTLQTNVSTNPTVAVSLEGIGGPVIQTSTTQLQFGTIAFGSTETLPLTVTYLGAGTLTFTPSIAGQNFIIAGSTCAGGLPTGQSCTLQVEFSPVMVGALDELLNLQANGSTIATVDLVGTANVIVPPGTPAKALVSPTYLQFGTIPFGTTETLGVSITNIGGGYLYATGSISPNSSNHIFAVTANNCKAVTSGNSCFLQVQFTPDSIATHDDFLAVNTNGGKFTVDLVGTGSGLSVLGGANGASLKFGSVSSGSTEVETLTVTNVGLPGTVMVGTAIKAGSGAGPYTVLTTSENTCLAGIAAGQSCILPIEFAPTSSGTHDDLLTLTPSPTDGAPASTVWLLGTTP